MSVTERVVFGDAPVFYISSARVHGPDICVYPARLREVKNPTLIALVFTPSA